MSHVNYGLLLWGSCSNRIANLQEEKYIQTVNDNDNDK